MVALRVSKDQTSSKEPDIFHAASSDDVEELFSCIENGQSLDDIDDNSGFTPMHLAILEGSGNFLAAAISLEFDPWIKDRNERLAIDHAAALNERELQRVLLDKMYPRRVQTLNNIHKLEI